MIILSQLAYIVTPMFSSGKKKTEFMAFIDLLEDKDELLAFSRALQTTERNQ